MAEKNQDWQQLEQLFETVKERKNAEAESSYTATLYTKGTKKIAQKVGEEAVEAVIAAMAGDKDELCKESADLLYHLFVLWVDAEVEPAEVFTILKERTGISGLEEKRNRKG